MLGYIIEKIIENKEWLFSGAGLAVITLFGSLLFKREPSAERKENKVSERSEEQSTNENNAFSKELTEVDKVAGRFRTILDLMNAGRKYKKFTIPQLAQLMKLHKISELEDVFTGKVEPSFEFIEDFSSTFGVNKNWLVEGKGAPYSNDLQSRSNPMDYLSTIEKLDPEDIYFVRENSDAAPAFILLKVSKWKYLVIDRTWHISDVVGAGGERQLVSFFDLVKELRDKRKLHTKCWGLTLDKNEFEELLNGEAFPGKYTDSGFSEDPWWDDLTDINHSYPIAENYEKWHGKSFVKAQSILRRHKSERRAN